MRDYFTAINWSRILAHKSVKGTWDIFVKHFTYAINRYIPFTTKPIQVIQNLGLIIMLNHT